MARRLERASSSSWDMTSEHEMTSRPRRQSQGEDVRYEAGVGQQATPGVAGRDLRTRGSRDRTAALPARGRTLASGSSTCCKLDSSTDDHSDTHCLLLRAVTSSDVDAVSWLLDLGADANTASGEGQSALQLAADLGNAELCEVLAKHGADVNAPTPGGLTSLFLASRRNLATVRTLLSFGADANVVSSQGETPLHAAASSGLENVITELIASGCDVDAVSNEGLTPLCLAANAGSQKALRVLLQNGADSNHVLGGKVGASWRSRQWVAEPQASAVDLEQQRLTTSSATHRDDTCWSPRVCLTRFVHGRHAFHQKHAQQCQHQQLSGLSLGEELDGQPAGSHNSFSSVGEEMSQQQTNNPYLTFRHPPGLETTRQRSFSGSFSPTLTFRPEREHLEPSFRGMTSLHRVSQLGMESVAKELLQAGADVNARTERGDTPLHFASLYSSISGRGEVTGLVRLLLRSGADLEALNSRGETPLHLAASVGDAVTTAILISAGASTDKADLLGDLPLHKPCRRVVAPESNFLRTVRLLLAARAPPNVANKEGQAPLHLLLCCQETATNLDLLRELLKHRADVNLRTPDGRHPLLIALRHRKLTSALALLKEGADPNATDSDGTTAMHLACQLGDAQLFRLLWSKGGDPCKVDSLGFTPLRCAVSCNAEAREAMLRACVDAGAASQQQLLEVTCSGETLALPSGLVVCPSLLSSPFHYAFSQGDLPALKLLWPAGAVSCRELWETRRGCLLSDSFNVDAGDRQAVHYVLHVSRSPPCLQVLTQWRISHLIGCGSDRASRVLSLGLPSMLKEFVLFSNF